MAWFYTVVIPKQKALKLKQVDTKRVITTAAAVLAVAFLTGSCKDENVEIVGVCPIVTSTSPANQEDGVGLNRVISATFNTNMDPATLTLDAFTIVNKAGGRTSESTQNSEHLTGAVTYDAATFTMHFTPTENTKANTTYTVTIGTSVKDLLGFALQKPYEWTFKTGTVPTVILTDPTNLSINVPIDKVISVTFSEPMDPASINNQSFTLSIGDVAVAGSINYSGNIATFTPTVHCLTCTSYVVTLTTAVKNLAGIPLANNYVWSWG
jgi:hypothetical protein